ncbi:MAG: hypothetical protein M0Z56_12920 [Desulfobacteraceae bacterium]|nr:hypothetical protein [Desulfobacteraceae bacterium]
MIANQKEFYGGAGLMAGFLIVLVLIFLPLYEGHNGLNFLDNLFNSISKGSAYYIPGLKENIAKSLSGKRLDLDVKFESAAMAGQCRPLFEKGGAAAAVDGAKLKVSGDLGQIMANCLDDADALYHNKSDVLEKKYGIKGRQTLYDWWVSLKGIQKSLDGNKQFDESKAVYTVMTKAVECSYNYFGIEAQNMSSRMGVVIFALVFYVIYTLWYGYAIMFMFEGWGLKISH